MEVMKDDGYRSYQGGYFRTLINPQQTSGSLALVEFTLPKGAEPPLHVHNDEDESFYLLEGSMSVRVDGEETILRPGEAVFAPKGKPHVFKILSDKATLLNLISPANLWNYFIEFSAPITELPQQLPAGAPPARADIERMMHVIGTRYNVHFVG